MTGESLSDQPSIPTAPIGSVERVQQVAESRQAATAAKLAELLEDPRVATLIETGQLTTGDALIKDRASGTQEPPAKKKPRQPPVNRRGGRSYAEPSDSELDPHWNTSMPLDSEATSNKDQNIEDTRLQLAAQTYQRELETVGAATAIAHLRNKGFRPNPDTHGKTVVRL